MTQLYEAALQKVTSAAAGPIVTLVATSGARPDIREIGVFVSSAPASGPTIGYGRPAAVGSGTPTGALGQATDAADPAAVCTLASSFATSQPTAPSVAMRRLSLPNSIGAGVIWTFDRNAFNVPQSGNVVIWQFSALAVTYDVYVQWEE
jgi:hypothetical protein